MRPINVSESLASGATRCEWRLTLPIMVSPAAYVHIGGAAMDILRLGPPVFWVGCMLPWQLEEGGSSLKEVSTTLKATSFLHNSGAEGDKISIE